MSRRVGRALALVLAGGLALSAGGAALAAPVGALKQFKVPTANSEPRGITTDTVGNIWFTEGTDSTNAPAKIGRITPAGAITEFDANCNFCILGDIVQGSDGILYFTKNDATLGRMTTSGVALADLPGVFSPNGGGIAAHGDDIWVTDFNNDELRRYNITSNTFTEFLGVGNPGDVTVDGSGVVWFTERDTDRVGRLDPSTGTFRYTDPLGVEPQQIAVASDGQIWFTATFDNVVGRVDPVTLQATTFPTAAGAHPEGIAAASGAMWFAQEAAGNIARIDNAGVITEAKSVKGSGPFGITVDANGNPWYTMKAANKIANFQLR